MCTVQYVKPKTSLDSTQFSDFLATVFESGRGAIWDIWKPDRCLLSSESQCHCHWTLRPRAAARQPDWDPPSLLAAAARARGHHRGTGAGTPSLSQTQARIHHSIAWGLLRTRTRDTWLSLSPTAQARPRTYHGSRHRHSGYISELLR